MRQHGSIVKLDGGGFLWNVGFVTKTGRTPARATVAADGQVECSKEDHGLTAFPLSESKIRAYDQPQLKAELATPEVE
jgi:hypothetical protein